MKIYVVMTKNGMLAAAMLSKTKAEGYHSRGFLVDHLDLDEELDEAEKSGPPAVAVARVSAIAKVPCIPNTKNNLENLKRNLQGIPFLGNITIETVEFRDAQDRICAE